MYNLKKIYRFNYQDHCHRDAEKRIDIKWLDDTLPYIDYPVYLGVTLDRTLTFKEYCIKILKYKQETMFWRNSQGFNGEHSHTTTGLALCYQGENTRVELVETYYKYVDVLLNDTYQVMTGCLWPRQINKIYFLSKIAPPKIRRSVATDL